MARLRLTTLPQGAYMSVVGKVGLGAGGQTQAMLMRHRIFSRYSDHELPILTFNPIDSYEPIRDGLRDQGLLFPDSRLVNMHEDLRERRFDDLPTVTVPAWTSGRSVDDVSDGYVWRRRHINRDSTTAHFDYLRTDGSLYARTSPSGARGWAAIFDHGGRPVLAWPTIGGLRAWWTSVMIPAEGRVFLLSDSRFMARDLSRLVNDRVFLLHQMHNPHLVGARHWSSPVSSTYRASMDHLGELDALISLSARQREDIRRRYGDTSNLFVIPNPVERPVAPDPMPPRRAAAIVMIARLARQKRVDRAIEAFAKVAAELPEATLDIYGDGDLRESLQQQIDDAALTGRVTLRGYDPQARERLWDASVLWLTSEYEGYPLSALEAMSHGCPVISLDIKYGPREQIDDGVDGYLIPQGQLGSLAERTVSLLRDPSRLERMGEAARRKATRHEPQTFLASWVDVLERVVALKPHRTAVRKASWDVNVNRRRGYPCSVNGTLTVDCDDITRLGDVTIGLYAYTPDRDDLFELPLRVDRVGEAFEISALIDRRTVRAIAPRRRTLQMRVQYVWHNSAGHVELLAPPRRSFRSLVGGALRRLGLRR